MLASSSIAVVIKSHQGSPRYWGSTAPLRASARPRDQRPNRALFERWHWLGPRDRLVPSPPQNSESRMLVSCDVDCGEVLPGHRFVARGLRHDGQSNDSYNGDYMGHYEGKPVHPMVSLVYVLVPGLTEQRLRDGGLDIDATVVLDPQPDPMVWGSVLTMGSERDARAGGAESSGAFGPFILPEATERITATLSQIFVVRVGGPLPSGSGTERQLGTLEVEISSGTVTWTPA